MNCRWLMQAIVVVVVVIIIAYSGGHGRLGCYGRGRGRWQSCLFSRWSMRSW